MGKLLGIEPSALWSHFESLCAIPHPSKHEANIRAFVLDFAKALNLEAEMDEVGNVVVRKEATTGMEDRKMVILQSHLDMVPQKNTDTVHDFKTDSIKAYIDGDWVTAEGTTLGADNGIGVAAILTVLAAKNIEHPALEALFTADEETGMTGAFGLKAGVLKGEVLLNLDSEDEGELYIGCAGGVDVTASFAYTNETLGDEFQSFKLFVKGLKGGHSGLDIVLGRGNANVIMNRLLCKLCEECGVRLSTLTGGSLRNAIPRESVAVVGIPIDKISQAKKIISKVEAEIANELKDVEPGFVVLLEEIAFVTDYLDSTTSNLFYRSIYASPNGVMRMSDTITGLTETSLNLAIVTVKRGEIKIKFLLRSSVDSAKDDLVVQLKSLYKLAGAKVEVAGAYPGWKPNPDSEILELMKEVYNNKWGRIPEVKAIHAGLECGLLGGVYPSWDMISFGPTIRFPHSPDEKVNIPSVGLFWEYLIETLKVIPLR